MAMSSTFTKIKLLHEWLCGIPTISHMTYSHHDSFSWKISNSTVSPSTISHSTIFHWTVAQPTVLHSDIILRRQHFTRQYLTRQYLMSFHLIIPHDSISSDRSPLPHAIIRQNPTLRDANIHEGGSRLIN